MAEFMRSAIRSILLLFFTVSMLAGCGGGEPSTSTLRDQEHSKARALAVEIQSGPQVIALAKIGETRISRTVYDYTFAVTIRNDFVARQGVLARLRSVGAGTSVVNGEVLIGDMTPGQTTTSSGTITLRHDRTKPFDQAAIAWTVLSMGSQDEVQLGSLLIAGSTSTAIYGIENVDYSVKIGITSTATAPAPQFELSVPQGQGEAVITAQSNDWRMDVSSRSLVSGAVLAINMRLVNLQTNRYIVIPVTVTALAPKFSATGFVQPSIGAAISTSSGQTIMISAGGLTHPVSIKLLEADTPRGETITILGFGEDISTYGIQIQLPNLNPSLLTMTSAATSHKRRAMTSSLSATNCSAFPNTSTPYLNDPNSLCSEWVSTKGWTFRGMRLPDMTWLEAALMVVKNQISLSKEVVSELHSVLPRQSVAVGDAEVVIFVHGFQSEAFCGICMGGGKGTWGEFPRLTSRTELFGGKKLIPFEFRWVTNARFGDAAYDLGQSIAFIKSALAPKRIHIVAHSFGGLVTRTLLENLATKSSEIQIEDARKSIDSVLTLGTPHSGIQEIADPLSAVDPLPAGQDSHIFAFCKQASCFEAGINYDVDGDRNARFPDLNIIYDATKTSGFLPRSLSRGTIPDNVRQFWVGIGSGRSTVTGGDFLISRAGQRFFPSLSNSTNYLDGSAKILGTYVREVSLESFQSVARSSGYIHSPKVIAPLHIVDGGSTKFGLEANVAFGCEAGLEASCDHASVMLLREMLTDSGPQPSTTLFREDFDGSTLDATKWTKNGSGTLGVGGGIMTSGCSSYASTQGKVTFSGPKLVIEGRFRGPGTLRDANIMLVDANTGEYIQVGDTNYQGYGFYAFGSGSIGVPPSGTGVTTTAFKEYRLTLNDRTLTFERGDTLSKITESITRTMGSSIIGRTFFLVEGTGGRDYCPGEYDWIRVGTEPTPNPALAITFVDEFDGSALDGLKWSTISHGTSAALSEAGGYLTINDQGGSCGACGVGDGIDLLPKIPPLLGDFEYIVSGEELERLSRDATKPMGQMGVYVKGSGILSVGIYIVGDALNNTGTSGHAIVMYSNSNSGTSYVPSYPSKSLSVGQYYALQFRIRRAAGVIYTGYKLSSDAAWTEYVVPLSFSPYALTTPGIVVGSGDGGGTRINSINKARLDFVKILN